MKKLISLVVVAAALLSTGVRVHAEDPAPNAAPAPVVTVPTFGNAICPIMHKPVVMSKFTDTDYGRIYVCCPPCIKKIQADPARASQVAYPDPKKVGNTVDPVTGAKIGEKPVFVTLQGHEIALASEDSLKAARANSQIVLAKVLTPDLVDVGNRTDPVTGKPVVDNAFVLIDKNLVRLSGPEVVEAVRKDPAAALKAAKEIAAKEAEERAKAATAPK